MLLPFLFLRKKLSRQQRYKAARTGVRSPHKQRQSHDCSREGRERNLIHTQRGRISWGVCLCVVWGMYARTRARTQHHTTQKQSRWHTSAKAAHTHTTRMRAWPLMKMSKGGLGLPGEVGRNKGGGVSKSATQFSKHGWFFFKPKERATVRCIEKVKEQPPRAMRHQRKSTHRGRVLP
jgi:hypothetical protein